jgi:hypothetical protein
MRNQMYAYMFMHHFCIYSNLIDVVIDSTLNSAGYESFVLTYFAFFWDISIRFASSFLELAEGWTSSEGCTKN